MLNHMTLGPSCGYFAREAKLRRANITADKQDLESRKTCFALNSKLKDYEAMQYLLAILILSLIIEINH